MCSVRHAKANANNSQLNCSCFLPISSAVSGRRGDRQAKKSPVLQSGFKWIQKRGFRGDPRRQLESLIFSGNVHYAGNPLLVSRVFSRRRLSTLARCGRLGGIGGRGGHGIEVGFGGVRRLLDGLLHRFESIVGGRNGALHHGDSGFRACGGVLGGSVNQVGKVLLCFASLGFHSLGEFTAGARGNVVQVAAIRKRSSRPGAGACRPAEPSVSGRP